MQSATRAHPRRRRISVLLAIAVAAATLTAATGVARSSDCASPADPRAGFRGYALDKGAYQGFDAPDPSVQLFPGGINDAGEITGEYIRPDGESGLLRDRRGCISSFDVPGARGTEALDNNNKGEIVVHYSTDTPIVNDSADPRTAVLYKGRVTPIAFPGARLTLGSGSITTVRSWAPTAHPAPMGTAFFGSAAASPPSIFRTR